MPGKRVPTPRPWIKLDVEFLSQDTTEQLRDKFGAAGPLLLVAVFLGAKESDLAGMRPTDEQGQLSIRAAALGRKIAVDAETVVAIVREAMKLGVLECLDGTNLDKDGRLVLRSLKREAWEPQDATAAARKARSREQDDDDEDDPIQGV